MLLEMFRNWHLQYTIIFWCFSKLFCTCTQWCVGEQLFWSQNWLYRIECWCTVKNSVQRISIPWINPKTLSNNFFFTGVKGVGDGRQIAIIIILFLFCHKSGEKSLFSGKMWRRCAAEINIFLFSLFLGSA